MWEINCNNFHQYLIMKGSIFSSLWQDFGSYWNWYIERYQHSCKIIITQLAFTCSKSIMKTHRTMYEICSELTDTWQIPDQGCHSLLMMKKWGELKRLQEVFEPLLRTVQQFSKSSLHFEETFYIFHCY